MIKSTLNDTFTLHDTFTLNDAVYISQLLESAANCNLCYLLNNIRLVCLVLLETK